MRKLETGTCRKNMTTAILKQLVKDKGIAFSSKAKNAELVQIFNTQAGYVTAYDKPVLLCWQTPTKKIYNHIVDSCQCTCSFHFQTGWLLFRCFVIS